MDAGRQRPGPPESADPQVHLGSGDEGSVGKSEGSFQKSEVRPFLLLHSDFSLLHSLDWQLPGLQATSNYMASSKQRAVVLLSGGMDSCVCATLAARECDAAAVHVSYGQRTEERERKAFLGICDQLGIRDRLVVRNDALRAI